MYCSDKIWDLSLDFGLLLKWFWKKVVFLEMNERLRLSTAFCKLFLSGLKEFVLLFFTYFSFFDRKHP